jgi:inner membrane protein
LDSLTHIVLGAAIADLSTGRRLGKRALLYGAVIGTLPDMDVAVGAFMSDIDKIIFHRGITHSMLFWMVMAPVCGWVISRLEAGNGIGFKKAAFMSFLILFSHALIDSFTSYGTRLLIPVTSEAYAFSTISIIDPFYSIWLWISVPWILFRRMDFESRKKILIAAIIISHLYLAGTIINKVYIDSQLERVFARQSEDVIRFTSKPGLFSNLLWRGVAETKDGYYTAYYALLAGPDDTEIRYEKKNHDLIQHIDDSRAVRRLISVTDGYFTVEQVNDSLFVNDLRFGRISEWSEEGTPYAFSYKLIESEESTDILRVPIRFEGERDTRMLINLARRIAGQSVREPSQSAPAE